MARTALPFLVAIATLVAATLLGSLSSLNNAIMAFRFEKTPHPTSGRILLVDIDGKSLDAVGIWPWPRSIHAAIIDRLREDGAEAIALDIDFSSRSHPQEDEALAEALKRAGGNVLLVSFRRLQSSAATQTVVAEPIEEFRAVSSPVLADVRPDGDGWVREMVGPAVINGQLLRPLSADLVGATIDIGESLAVDFSISPRGFDRVSAVDLINGAVPPELIDGKLVIVGATAPELGDRFLVPAHGIVSGSTLHAIAAETLMQNRLLRPLGPLPTVAMLFLLASVALSLSKRGKVPPLLTAGVIFGIAGAAEVIAATLQARTALVFDSTPVLVGAVIFSVLAMTREMDVRRLMLRRASEENQDLRAMLTRVVEDSFAGILIARRDGVVQAASREAAAMLGLPAGAAIGRRLEDILPQEVMTSVAMTLAVHDAGKGTATSNPPADLVIDEGKGGRRILEYVVTPSLTARPEPGSAGEVYVCVMLRDVTAERLAAERDARMLRTDAATGVLNRFGFREQVGEALGAGPLSVALFNIRRFSALNESFGSGVGDRILTEFAKRLEANIRPGEVLGRVSGDRFAVLLAGPATEDALCRRARAIAEAGADPFVHADHRLTLDLSIGIATGRPGETADDILQHANVACVEAKTDDGGGLRIYDEAFDAKVKARRLLERDLTDALDRGEFHVVYQPQVEIATGRLIGVEALVRWTHPDRGPVAPSEFIPVVEQIGLVPGLGDWVLREACREVASWPAPIKVAVNLSPLQFEQMDLVQQVFSAIANSKLPPTRLALEITESLFMRDGSALAGCFEELRSAGVEIALDDFGTGYSSLGYIRRFPLDKVKIDRSFVTGLPDDKESAAIVEAVVGMSHRLGFRVIAEGIETQTQADALLALGCGEAQGFLFGRPMTGDQIRAMLEANAVAGARRASLG